ncbi:MAG TPA: DUF2721 domain-containing protein [Sphingobium sp.]|uniref:DUF2721 domain-containing protein n=1 Tax=Sphingobium sp. TaxID=1912891 RepID=UPI002ED0CDC3
MADVLPIPVVSDVAHIIQLALAPVFLLTGVGAFLNVCTGRLARIIDRSRVITPEIESLKGPKHDRLVEELRVLDRRMGVVDTAILLSVVSACLVCLVVVLLFASEVIGRSFGSTIALLFIGSMLCQAGAFATFIVEIRLASRTIRITKDLLFHQADDNKT